MRKHFALQLPSPAMCVALAALFIALGGAAYAATALPANSVGTRQLKDNAVTTTKIKNGAVTAAKINPSGLTVPTALHANNAATARNASKLGGAPASAYEKFTSTLPSGKTETGVWVAAAGNSTSGESGTDMRFYPPLAAPLDAAHVIYVSGTSATHCPGIGGADPGYFCMYQQQISNMTFSSIGNGKLEGAAADGAEALFLVNGLNNFAAGHWAVTAP